MDSEDSGPEDQSQYEQVARSPADMVSSFISHAPPGQINEVLGDVRGIVENEQLMQEQIAKVLPNYIKKQLTPVKLDETNPDSGLVLSNFNDLGNGRYADPKSKQSFAYNHLTGQVSDLQPWEPDQLAEPWRAALEVEWSKYTREHYHEGTGSVFSSNGGDEQITLNACLEGHQFQPKKFWNGRWRSIWSITLNLKDQVSNNDTTASKQQAAAELRGLVKLHVHYYEDGNVQLVSSRQSEQSMSVLNPKQLAQAIVEAVKKFENEYQKAISGNYQTMSDTTFKALRRPLPVIRSKIEWNKLKGYKIGSELKQQ